MMRNVAAPALRVGTIERPKDLQLVGKGPSRSWVENAG